LGDGDKGIVKVYGEEKNMFFGAARAANAKQKSLLPARQAQRTNHNQERTSLFYPV
jgi:hypothetical protein